MSQFQFDYNPLTPIPKPSPNGNFPWGMVILGLCIFTAIVAYSYSRTKPESEPASAGDLDLREQAE